MRNLQLRQTFTKKLSLVDSNCRICSDADSGNVYIVNGNCIACLGSDLEETKTQVDELGNDDGVISSFVFLSEFQSLCIGKKSGDILMYDVKSGKAQSVGNVTGGILAMQWSPDYELVVIVSGEEKVLLMTKDFDLISEKELHLEEFGECVPITAGWGSKETQFHGSEGKQAAKVEAKPPDPAFSWDDKCPRVSWRGDGQYFVTSCISPTGGNRKLRLWSRDGILQYTGEDLNGLEQALGWKPSGSVIASSQRLPNKHMIVFFEKNGLNHGGFQLPFGPNEFQVKEVFWSPDSTILAVVGSMFPSDESSLAPKELVLLYSMKNYHWYLKQTLQFNTNERERLADLHWDEGSVLTLHVLSVDGQYWHYALSWAVHRSHCGTEESTANVAVIDGDTVSATLFKVAVVPPPMCSYKVKTATPVSEVAFGVGLHENDFVIALQNESSLVFVLSNSGDFVKTSSNRCTLQLEGAGGENGFKVTSSIPECYGPYRIKFDGFQIPKLAMSLHHWTWPSKDYLLCVCTTEESHQLLRVDIRHEQETHLVAKSVCLLKDSVLTISTNSTGTVVCIQYQDGSCAAPNSDGIVVPWLCSDGSPLKLPRPCANVAVCEVLKQPRVIALSDRFELFCDSVKICDDCTSFRIHGKFILLTTHHHTLRCLLLDFDLANLLNGGLTESLNDAPRELESGSLLVTSVPADGRVVLQLPRGNLETISPRVLVLDRVCDHLDRKEYRDAFLLMKVNRIDLNLLCDHDPSTFLNSLSEFVQQVNEPTDLNLFITGLTDKDVSATMYASAYRARKRVPFVFKKNKRDEICDSLRNVLEHVDYDKYLLSILTCHAKKTDPELDEALSKIYSLKDSGNKAGTTCDEALKYLFYLVDRKDLFDVALGTYNFDIVLMVAEKSQKDPKEYVPFLNKLNKLEPDYRRFTIDMHLERYKKALKNISLCGEAHFSECLNLIKSQRLYTTALELFPEGSQERKEVWGIYGDYLFEKKHYEEAGLVYWRCEKLQKAVKAFEMCLNWNLLLSTAYQMKYDQDSLQALANRTIDALVLAKRYKEASEISETFLKDEEKTVRILLDAHMWDVALAKIHHFSKLEFTEKIWKPAVISELEFMLETVDSLKATWSKHVARLMIVREHKANEEQGDGDFDDGAFSDVASVTSRTVGGSVAGGSSISGSIATMRTSRNRKKQERKKYVLKEGSRYEDLALIIALGEVASSSDKLQEECRDLLRALVLCGLDQEARNLQHLFSALLDIIEKDIPNVWPPETAESALPLGPHSSSTMIAEAVQKQRIVEHVISDPALRQPPTLRRNLCWKLQMLT